MLPSQRPFERRAFQARAATYYPRRLRILWRKPEVPPLKPVKSPICFQGSAGRSPGLASVAEGAGVGPARPRMGPSCFRNKGAFLCPTPLWSRRGESRSRFPLMRRTDFCCPTPGNIGAAPETCAPLACLQDRHIAVYACAAYAILIVRTAGPRTGSSNVPFNSTCHA